MHGKLSIKITGKDIPLWFNNYSKIELGKAIIKSKNGYPAKPEESVIIQAIDELANSNHILLMKEVIWSGILGHAYAVDETPLITRKELSADLAIMSNDQLYQIWVAFLESMGMNLDEIKQANSNKKKQKGKLSPGMKP